jgi:Ran GTPase-activating protein (RanGAP) involved in mRNA processing and transport
MSAEADASKSITHKFFNSVYDLILINEERLIITSITLITGNLDSCAMILIGDWLKNNTTLTSLILTKNQIKGASPLAEALMVNTSLTTLDLSDNKIGNRSANAFFTMLQTNNTIRSLHFGYNNISDTGIVSLENNTSLTTLNLRFNKILNTGLVSLVESIKLNKGLRTLDLGYNIIGDSGDAFKTLFEYNSTLLELDIGSTNITHGVFDAFIDILKMPSCALKKFTITSGDLSFSVSYSSYNHDVHFNYDKLIDAIKYNTTLQEFWFNIFGVDRYLGWTYCQTINEVLERNKLIEKIYPLMCCSQRRGMYLPDEIWTKVVRIC